MKRLLFFILLSPAWLSAQIGGSKAYDFLNLSPSARISALGGVAISMRDDDGAFAFQNPALLSDSTDGFLNVSIFNYISDISYGNVNYAKSVAKVGTFHGGFQYVNYGNFKQADEYGNLNGTYHAGDLAFVVGMAREYKRFSYGANLKLINANYGGYSSFAGAIDLGGAYHSKDGLFCAGIVLKNWGGQLSKFTPTAQKEKLPTQLQAGISYKLQYMPMRLYLTATNLQQANLVYVDPVAPVDKDFNGNALPVKKRTGDKIVAHFVIGTEFFLGKNLRLRAGYNHLRRIELRSQGRAGLSGFTLGAGIRISKFRLDYSFVRYAAGMNTHHFGISTNLSSFRKK